MRSSQTGMATCTYSLVVRKCRGAQIDPNFERGATRLQNAMKAAACLLDIELSQMSSEIRSAYRTNPEGARHLCSCRL